MKPHEWLSLTVETAVIVVGLLHIYFETRKKQKKHLVRVKIWLIDQNKGVRKKKNDKK